MKIPRVRFTVRQIMVAVAVLGVTLWMARGFKTLLFGPSEREVAASMRRTSEEWGRLAKSNPAHAEEYRRLADSYRKTSQRLEEGQIRFPGR